MKDISIDTLLIHGGLTTDSKTGAVNTPIYQTSTYKQIALGVNLGYEYSRTKNPTRDGIESLIAELEYAKFGFAFASGLAAIATVLSIFKSNDEILILNNIYGGTFRLLDKVFLNFNIKYKIIDDIKDIENAISINTKAILYETPANPLLNIISIEQISKIAHSKGILHIVDNTFMSPYLQNPLKFGADIVIHSATKYLGGHSDLIAGCVVCNDELLAEKIGFLQNAIGAILSPNDSFLLIRGIKTLGLRMQKHSQNALEIAQFLNTCKYVKKVYYPSLKNHTNYDIHSHQARSGGGVISFELENNIDINKFCQNLELISLAESLGGVESLICHPASMTHASIPIEIREKMGIKKELLRLSIGIENANDLIKDIENSFKKSQ